MKSLVESILDIDKNISKANKRADDFVNYDKYCDELTNYAKRKGCKLFKIGTIEKFHTTGFTTSRTSLSAYNIYDPEKNTSVRVENVTLWEIGYILSANAAICLKFLTWKDEKYGVSHCIIEEFNSTVTNNENSIHTGMSIEWHQWDIMRDLMRYHRTNEILTPIKTLIDSFVSCENDIKSYLTIRNENDSRWISEKNKKSITKLYDGLAEKIFKEFKKL